MTAFLLALARRMCDPAKLEYLEGDLRELFEARAADWGRAAAWRRTLRDAAGVLVRHSRLTPTPRRLATPSMAAALAATAILLGPTVPGHFTVDAQDPAGRFTLEVRDGRVVAATMEGERVTADRIVQRADTLVIRGGDAGRDFTLLLRARGVHWDARAPRAGETPRADPPPVPRPLL